MSDTPRDPAASSAAPEATHDDRAPHDPLLHIATADEWDSARAAGEVRPASLVTEGFVHCSWAHQVVATAGRHFAGRDDLVLLVVDEAAVAAHLVEEDTSGAGARFPHVHAPIPVAAVVRVLPFRRDADGTFVLPAELHTADG